MAGNTIKQPMIFDLDTIVKWRHDSYYYWTQEIWVKIPKYKVLLIHWIKLSIVCEILPQFSPGL